PKFKNPYEEIIEWFQSGNNISLKDDMNFKSYLLELQKVEGLEKFIKKYPQYFETEFEMASLMEFILDGLHQNSKIAKDIADSRTSYKDMLGSMLSSDERYGYEEDYYKSLVFFEVCYARAYP